MKTPYDIIIKPVVSETSMMDAEQKKYTFKVDPRANKTQVKMAIEEIFGVEVKKVNIINIKNKLKKIRRTQGMTASSKKAIITLTDASKEIEFFQRL